jgi:hypothetical protein
VTSNAGKRLERLHKELVALGAQSRAFHFIVGDVRESAEAKLERAKAEGRVQAGDEVQLIDVAWAVNELKGQAHIPEGSSKDPFEEPALPPPLAVSPLALQKEREEKWKDHLRKIEADGTRFDPDKPKSGNGIW